MPDPVAAVETAQPEATPQAPAAPVAATPPTPPAQATPEQTPPHQGWVPSYRIRETREAALREAQTQWQSQQAAYEQRLQQIQSQLHALVGVQQPANPEANAVKGQFGQLYPGLAKLEAAADELLALRERAGDMEQQSSHYWTSYGRQSMDRLFDHASKSLGSPLTEEGKRALHSAFTGFVSSSPELTERYATDPTLVEEFWTNFTSSFIDPARRAASATVAGRAAAQANLPQDAPSGAVRTTPAPQPKDLDERAAQAWAHYQTIKK